MSEEFGLLKRYNILLRREDGFASSKIKESDIGKWVRYSDYDNLNRRRELVHRKLIDTLKREKELHERIKQLKEKYEPSEP